jgi:hypothetical protein
VDGDEYLPTGRSDDECALPEQEWRGAPPGGRPGPEEDTEKDTRVIWDGIGKGRSS